MSSSALFSSSVLGYMYDGGDQEEKKKGAAGEGGETHVKEEDEPDYSAVVEGGNKVESNNRVFVAQRSKDKRSIRDTCTTPSSSLFRAFLRSLFAIDHTQIALIPAMRTALIMMVEMSFFGIDNNSSTAFRLGALFVGLTDPNGSLSKRLRSMGYTLLTVLFFGTLLPGLTWRSYPATIVTAFMVALLTGLSPALMGSSSSSPDDALFLAMKLGMALFAINGGVNRSTNGYGGLGNCTFWTFCGSFTSLVAALLPEIVGNRDAIRTDLFKVVHGFGMNISHWGKHWGTVSHLNAQVVPTVTFSVYNTKAMISDDETEEAMAKEWLLRIIESADRIRVGSLCFSNDFQTMNCYSGGTAEEIDAFFLAVGRACNRISFALQFPWLIRYVPFLKNRAAQAVDAVNETAAAISRRGNNTCESYDESSIHWLPSITELIRFEVQYVSELILDCKTWPTYSSLTSLPRRIIASFPSTMQFDKDSSWAIRGYGLRLAIAFTLATIPELVIKKSNAHWFPMTVAFVMGPSQAATYEKVVHRVIGTLLGLGFGAAMTPFFRWTPALIILLGLNTYAAVLFFTPNYAAFTFFITGWVYVVGQSHPPLVLRCCSFFNVVDLVISE